MNCNGTRLNIFVAVYLMLVLLQLAIAQQVLNMDDAHAEEDQLDTNGNLYDLFKRRLEKFRNELSFDVEPSGTDNGIKQQYKVGAGNKKRAISDCLYEEFKRRVDKFYNGLTQNPNKSFKRKIAALLDDTEQKRSSIRDHLYEEYKKRLDKINNELALDGEKVFDRSGRNSQCATGQRKDSCNAPAREGSNKQMGDRLCKQDIPSDRVIDKAPKTSKETDYNKLRTKKSRKLSVFSNEANLQNARSTTTGLKAHVDPLTISESESTSEQQSSAPVLESKDNLVDERESAETDEESVTRDEDGQDQLYPADALGDNIAPYGTDIGSSYPTVLTKAFETSMSPINPTPGNLIATVAKKMNTSTLDLAQKIAGMTDLDTASIRNDPKFVAVLQKFISNTVGMDTTVPPVKPQVVVAPPKQDEKERKPKETIKLNIVKNVCNTPEECEDPDANSTSSENSTEPGNVGEILEKILTKLERIQQDKNNASDKDSIRPEGAPCDVLGSWNSYQMGIRFEITLAKPSDRQLGQAEKGNKLLAIEASECIPPKHKGVLDLDWKYMGSAMNQLGGPLYIYTQQRADNIVALFAGSCRTCGGMDTIFGSWTFLYPCKDCQDISTSIENRHDIFRRYKMEVKRKQRFKELLFQKSHYGKMQECMAHK